MKEYKYNINQDLEKILPEKINDQKLFFISKSNQALKTANILFNLSSDKNIKENLKIDNSFETYNWVVVSSYYSMFYILIALLNNEGYKLSTSQSSHFVVKNSFQKLFIDNGKLTKKYAEIYDIAFKDANKISQLQNDMNEMLKTFEFEQNKRNKFQYIINKTAEKRHASTAVLRAKEFTEKIKELLE